MNGVIGASSLEWASNKETLAEALGLQVGALNYYAYGLGAKRYRTSTLKKRSGGERLISCPIPPLKEVQRELVKLLEPHYRPRGCVYGYVKGTDAVKKALHHVDKRWVLRVDLQDFFPTLHFGRVRGLLMAPPFSLTPQVALVISALCTHEGKLPQGAPTSPLLSNLLVRGLDKSLVRLARQHACKYTRYCDDLVFSCNRHQFPRLIAYWDDPSGADGEVVVGEALGAAIAAAGLKVNPDKLSLRRPHQRQMVTGSVVNERLNVPREYLRALRAVLHVWANSDYQTASDWFFEKHYHRNRPGRRPPRFHEVMRGRVTHVGRIRGWSDPMYLRLASKLCKCDPGAQPKYERPAGGKVCAFVEGKTDRSHMSLALLSLQKKGKHTGLTVDFQIPPPKAGSQELFIKCKHLCSISHAIPQVFIFDCDEPKMTSQVTELDGSPKAWGNNVFSLVIPPPPHRAEKLYCVEMLYHDDLIRTSDEHGRRLFLRSEFDSDGFHLTGEYVWTRVAGNLVVDDMVFDRQTQRKVSFTKQHFCDLADALKESVDFSGFEPLFQTLGGIARGAAKECTEALRILDERAASRFAAVPSAEAP